MTSLCCVFLLKYSRHHGKTSPIFCTNTLWHICDCHHELFAALASLGQVNWRGCMFTRSKLITYHVCWYVKYVYIYIVIYSSLQHLENIHCKYRCVYMFVRVISFMYKLCYCFVCLFTYSKLKHAFLQTHEFDAHA